MNTTTAANNSNSNNKLSSEQVQNLLQKLSSDEQKQLGDILKKCTTEMTLTRGLPFAAAVIGSFYLVRQRLPPALHFGPKKWPFYLVIGIGALTSANLLSMPTCTQRIQPYLNSLWQKYSQADSSSTTNYEDLRRYNRERISAPAAAAAAAGRSPKAPSQYETRTGGGGGAGSASGGSSSSAAFQAVQEIPSQYDAYTYSPSNDSGGQKAGGQSGQSQALFNYDQPSYMSGTPVGKAKKTQYGDEGFS